MHSVSVRQSASGLLRAGRTVAEVSRETGIPLSTVRRWSAGAEPVAPLGECPICQPAVLDGLAYSALLGFYLGDGHISRAPRFYALRIACDAKYSGIVEDVVTQLRLVRPGMRVFCVSRPGCVVVQAHWKHWPCLFPQHGPGYKHQREIVLQRWQREIVESHPAAFLRGLFHSDGARSRNWTRRMVAGEMKRYDYPRWQFTNKSDDIKGLCCLALDLLEIPWRQSNEKTISVSRRPAVARLDRLIGLKT